MNPARSQLQKIAEIIGAATSGIICLPEGASVDAVAAGTALYLGLRQLNKNVSIASSGAIQSSLTAADQIHSSFSTSGENLVVTFPYTDGSVEKVDYYIQGNEFNIIIVPGANTPKLQQDQVRFSYAGGDVEFVITIDSPTLKSLGNLYSQNQDQFKGKKIINLDRHVSNSFYGTVNFVSKTTSSNVELVMAVLTTLNVQITSEIATNLYAGILSATQNFTAPGVNPQTFEASAYLMKAGAGHGNPPPAQMYQTPVPQSAPVQPPRHHRTTAAPHSAHAVQQSMPQTTLQHNPAPNAYAQKGADRQAVRTSAQLEQSPGASVEGVNPQEIDDDEWLKPNIFKPGDLL